MKYAFLGKDGQPSRRTKKAGTDFGLFLTLNVEQNEYYGGTSLVGLKILIHHHETPPMVEELGFSLAPGTSTLAAIRKEKV